MLHEYNSDIFTDLPHYDRAKCVVGTNALITAIDELGKVITTNELEATVGVCLLHKHFDMGSDEVLLETAHGNTSKLAPIARGDIQGEIIPYMWKINKNMYWSPLEFVYSTKSIQDAFEKVMKNEAFLEGIGTVLVNSQVIDVLGLSLLHRDHINGSTCGTLETSDENNRELVVVPMDKAIKDAHRESIQTLWKFGFRKTSEDACGHCVHNGACEHCSHCSHYYKPR